MTPLPQPIYTQRKADVSTVAWLAQAWRETFNEVERWQRAVNEGGQFEAALRFARYVLWSGLIPLCKAYAQESPKIDGALLEWKAEELQRSVQARFDRRGNGRIELEETQVERINHKLDVLAAHVARLGGSNGAGSERRASPPATGPNLV